MKPEHSDFIRRVANGEVYTGLSGEAMARWAVGWAEKPDDYPRDRGDFARCMNVYWAAPDDLKPMMRRWLIAQAKRLRREARKLEGDAAWMIPTVNFVKRTDYRPRTDWRWSR